MKIQPGIQQILDIFRPYTKEGMVEDMNCAARARAKERRGGDHIDRDGEHYGPYGIACINTGQFDAGECWKCTIKRLRAQRDECRNLRKDMEILLAELQKDYCPMGCIFGLNKHGKLHLWGDCRAPESEHCKARLKDETPGSF